MVQRVHPVPSGGKEPQRAGAIVEKWGFLLKNLPCIPRAAVPDLYSQAEKRVDRVDEVIARIPLVDNGADAERDGAITLQEKAWLLTRWLSERNRLRDEGSTCSFRYRLTGLIKTLCGVLVPAIVSTLSTLEAESQQRAALMLLSICVSVLGTLSTALEDFYQFGSREFWEWYSVSGMYSRTDGVPNYARTNQAFQNFARIVEATIFSAQEGYLNTIMAGATNKDD